MRCGIMATRSFTDTYVINREDVDKYHNIMKSKQKAKSTKVIGHKDVKERKAIMEMLGINK
jgi:coproporphyrinogen III oxidase-like Fe-S oxidoreductase